MSGTDLGTRISISRKKIGISQTELSKRLGVNRSTVANWETNNREPNLEMIQKLSSILDVSISYLTGESDLPLNDKKTEYVHDILTASNDEIRKKYIDEVDGIPVTDMEIDHAREQIRALRKMLNTFQRENKGTK